MKLEGLDQQTRGGTDGYRSEGVTSVRVRRPGFVRDLGTPIANGLGRSLQQRGHSKLEGATQQSRRATVAMG